MRRVFDRTCPMSLTLDIKPEVQAELARKAAAQGRPVEAVAAALLEEAVHLPAATSSTAREAQAGNLIELFEPVRGLLTDGQIDTIFNRNRLPSRPMNLA